MLSALPRPWSQVGLGLQVDSCTAISPTAQGKGRGSGAEGLGFLRRRILCVSGFQVLDIIYMWLSIVSGRVNAYGLDGQTCLLVSV